MGSTSSQRAYTMDPIRPSYLFYAPRLFGPNLFLLIKWVFLLVKGLLAALILEETSTIYPESNYDLKHLRVSKVKFIKF